MYKKHIILSASILITGTGIKAANFTADKHTHPNVILILADDMGYGDVSALNEHSKIHTPHIDALARQGITFTDAHSSSSVSTPSRYALLTGRYAFRTSLKKWTPAGYASPLITAERLTLGNLMGESGYSTACIGKWHLGWDWAKKPGKQTAADHLGKGQDEIDVDFTCPISQGPTKRGFDYFYGIAASLDMPPYVYVENEHVTAVPNRIGKGRKGLQLFREGPQGADFEPETCLPTLGRKALEYLNSRGSVATNGESGACNNASPFFLYLPLTAPHTPILPTADFQGKSKLSPYGDFVLMVDDLVGRIQTTLQEKGLTDNTIIIFTTDNGCAPYADMKGMIAQGHNSSYIYRGAKSDIYDGGHRIPLIISWGTHYQDEKNDELVCLSDFYATFAEMCHVQIPGNVAEDSYSIWPVLNDKGHTRREYLVHHSGEGIFSIRDKRWKLIFGGGSGGWSYPSLPKDASFLATQPALQLYDMKADPSEQKNVAEQHPDIIEQLTGVMREYITNGRSTPGDQQKNDESSDWPQIKLIMGD